MGQLLHETFLHILSQCWISLTSLAVISATHVHKIVLTQRWGKNERLAFRLAVAVTILCLPLAESLDSLRLISTSAGLVIFVLVVEIYGTACVLESFFRDGKKCQYSADCKMRKKDLEDAMKTGAVINVESLAEKNKAGHGIYELT